MGKRTGCGGIPEGATSLILISVISNLPAIYQHVADLIGAEPKDIVFTSGATETNNMAIKGVARFHKEKKRHIITTQTVHRYRYVDNVLITISGAQMRSRFMSEARRGGIRCDIFACSTKWSYLPGKSRGGVPAGYISGFDHGSEQRNWGNPTTEGDRRNGAQASWCLFPHRCCSSGWKNSTRRERNEH